MFTRPRNDRVWQPTAWAYNPKLAGREMAQRLGVRMPALLAGPAPLTELSPPQRAGVLKPAEGTGGRGILPLVPTGDGLYHCLLTGDVGKWQEHTDVAWRQASSRYNPATQRSEPIPAPVMERMPWIVEELVGDGARIPDDVKCYCIGGRVELIRQRRPGRGRGGRNGAVHCFWSRSWDRLRGVDEYRPVADLPRPRGAAEIVHAAERIARFLGSPIVRVDMYAGAIFGEITPRPAGDHWTPAWDMRLGAAWEAAVIRRE